MSELINDGSEVCEVFRPTFVTILDANTRASVLVHYALNVQDGINVSISCMTGTAREYLAFVDALDAELSKHGVALVFAYDYMRNDQDATNVCYVVCNED